MKVEYTKNAAMVDIIDGGKNIKMKKLASCVNDENWTLNDCEKDCPKYYGCYAVAMANDILREYEMCRVSYK